MPFQMLLTELAFKGFFLGSVTQIRLPEQSIIYASLAPQDYGGEEKAAVSEGE